MTNKELAQLAAKLTPDAREGMKRWALKQPHGTAARLGMILDRKKATSYGVDVRFTFGPRTVKVLVRHGLAEERLLWLCITSKGEQVAKWLAGVVSTPEE